HRLAQVGIVDAADGPRLQNLLAPGQRLVTRDGDLWRWDGFVASADAPTPAALRLAQKNRLAELNAAAAEATQKVRAFEERLAEAERTARESAEAERHARDAWRAAQHAVGAARETLARAEKAAGELSSRRAALEEARARIAARHAEAAAAADDAQGRLSA